MKRIELVSAAGLLALAAFVGREALDAQSAARSRVQVDSGSAAAVLVDDESPRPRIEVTRARATKSSQHEHVRQRIADASPSTYLGEVLSAHDSSLARWPDRRTDPVRVWIQPVTRVRHWSPAFVRFVREAFVAWEASGVPLAFTFVLDSASADVRVTWVDRFAEPISGKTLWTHDAHWWILDGAIMLAVHHRGGDPLDSAAVRAIALHEVGHLVGLDHTADSTSIMAPRVRVKHISAADRATAQLLYALPPGRIGSGSLGDASR
jgi:hypothetical protein